MPAPIFRLALGAGLVALSAALLAAPSLAQSTGKQSAAKENAEGDPNGAIRALGATGFNARDGARPPPVDVPPLNEGPSGTGGPPRGTASSGRRK